MDVVFHRNCLDGAYSAYLMFLFNKTLSKEGYSKLLDHLKAHTSNQLRTLQSQCILVNECPNITEQFFHTKSQIPFHCVSMYAGDLFPIAPSVNGNILFLLDISPSTNELMVSMSQRFSYVIIIDHHTSFSKCLDFIKQNSLKNVFYYWNQSKCATQLVQQFLFQSFGFPKNFSSSFQKQLTQKIKYVASNDLKKNQDRISKQFVLGFYYFQIQLSHHNPLLFKRIWSLGLQLIINKGEGIYKDHIRCLLKEIENCDIYTIIKSKYKGMTFLACENKDKGLISDLGSLLAYLSAIHKYENLGMIYKKGNIQCKISFRSYQFIEHPPRALEISESYGGGGHHCAAGCSMDKNTFKNHFKYQGKIVPPLKLSVQQIQQILFHQSK